MSSAIAKCIRKYIKDEYSGGVIGISKLAAYCNCSEGVILAHLANLEAEGEVKILKRYFCPEGHPIPLDSVPLCEECNYPYSKLYITLVIYVEPKKVLINKS